MASIARITVDATPGTSPAWRDVVASVSVFLGDRGLAVQDAVVLVPFAQHIALARRAWALLGGWMPRIETAQTLAQSLSPLAVAEDGPISFDVGLDRLAAAELLRAQAWAADWSRRDARGFAQAVDALVLTAHALARAASAASRALRDAYWQQGRALLPPLSGPGGTERALARIALEWAASSAAPVTDVLYALQPSAWVVIQAGGPNALAEQMMAAADAATACLVVVADPPVDASLAAAASITWAACDGFEHEAQCAAAQVLDHLQHGITPVALVAEDRVLVRRVRALLERQQVPLLDETGWKLSTTRAAAQVLSLLRAAEPVAPANALMDWLKTAPAHWPGLGDVRAGSAELEAACRRYGWRQLSAIDPQRLQPAGAALWAVASQALASLVEVRRQPLARWLDALRVALQATGTWDALLADAAGQQVATALRLAEPAATGAAASMALDDVIAWIDGVLEDASFVPPAPKQVAPVVITPLTRVPLRPFAALVMPGADERHLGVSLALHPLLSDDQAVALGLPGRQQRHEAEALHFAHAMTVPRVSLFYRRNEGSEPQAISPLVERLVRARERAGRSLEPWADPRVRRSFAATPVHMPAPSAVERLPKQMSASACEALRACPYRFYALNLLGLREADELDEEVAKRDYGTWLHAVLFEFHQSRASPGQASDETQRLLDIAAQQQAVHGLADADFLPFAASFEQLAPRYVEWLHGRDAKSAQWWQGEWSERVEPPELQGLALHGRIDRADRIAHEGQAAIELIDYKTGSADALRQQVKQPLEDTQLAFYAALVRGTANAPLHASYLALDGSKGIETITHPEVEDSAEALVVGLAHDMSRLRAGAGLPALGEGRVCDFCAARGLCRKDQWSLAEGGLP